MINDWSNLLARSADGRRAIYDERFPGRWAEVAESVTDAGQVLMTEGEAIQILAVFASNWEHLEADPTDSASRFYLVVLDLDDSHDHVGVAFVGRALRDDQLVLTHPIVVRRF